MMIKYANGEYKIEELCRCTRTLMVAQSIFSFCYTILRYRTCLSSAIKLNALQLMVDWKGKLIHNLRSHLRASQKKSIGYHVNHMLLEYIQFSE